jgi:twitching motility protein PilT
MNALSRKADAQKTGAQNSASGVFEALLAKCVARDASDLHLVEGQPPMLRVHGPLERIEADPSLPRETMLTIAGQLAERFDAERPGSIDGSFSAPDGTRFRFNIYLRSGGVAIALRRLEDRFRTLKELGLPDSLYKLCDLPNGLVVLSGSTGAGKSTTLATLIDRINQSHACHVITIEDPIEYIHQPHRALVNQREIGKDATGFNEALVASLRQDPDVVLVGEIRDVDTIRTAITAAETGHVVFTTVHASDCVSTIERLAGVFPADEQDAIRQQLALVLRAIVNQRLLVADGAAVRTEDSLLAGRSRVVASEVLMATPAVANLILSGKSSQIYSAMEAGGSLGMQTLEQDLARLWAEGLISERTAVTGAKRGDLVRDRYEAMAGTSEVRTAVNRRRSEAVR